MAEKVLPIESVEIVDDIYPRISLNNERIDMFTENFLTSPDDVPPIIVAPFANEERYILIDGNHRFAGASKAAVSSIKAVVQEDFVVNDINSDDTRRELLARAALANWFHGQPLTNKEKAQVVRKLYSLNYNVDSLSLKFRVHTATIYRWIEDIKRKDDEEKKQKLKDLVNEGLSISSAAEKVGLHKSSASRLLRDTKNKNADQIEPASKNVAELANAKNATLEESPNNLLKNKTSEIQPADMTVAQANGVAIWGSEVVAKLDEFYEFLLGLNDWPKEIDDYLTHMLIPLLIAKSPTVSQIINKGYEDMWRHASEERDSLQNELVTVTRTLSAVRAENEELRRKCEEKQLCADDCSISKNWVKEEYRRSLEGEVSNAVVALEMLCGDKDTSYIADVAAQALEKIYTHIEWAHIHFLYSPEDLAVLTPLYELIKDKNLQGVKNARIRKGVKRIASIDSIYAAA